MRYKDLPSESTRGFIDEGRTRFAVDVLITMPE